MFTSLTALLAMISAGNLEGIELVAAEGKVNVTCQSVALTQKATAEKPIVVAVSPAFDDLYFVGGGDDKQVYDVNLAKDHYVLELEIIDGEGDGSTVRLRRIKHHTEFDIDAHRQEIVDFLRQAQADMVDFLELRAAPVTPEEAMLMAAKAKDICEAPEEEAPLDIQHRLEQLKSAQR